ncbi:lysozyme inhibitor LprI family protein [Crocosphaera sp. UHCC 0190]|uniref:lysozyme inhibitor LprI family protein n=1 Tax=Crocosphaera sp. UHCC 0190 TaxID=3110246 RepID=UPI002B21B329|nr:lysozyme inhibitor LprI family protein [Crocosphaera sp. UHCC 0190]MEA5509506.1 lysozyme inhibitor LprI family protein [Crocosphaera sp. UHCC 0190]
MNKKKINLKYNLFSVLSISILSVTVASPSHADDPTGSYFDGTEIKCPGIPFAESTVVQCNTIAFQNADRELNQLYQKLMKTADTKEKEYLQTMQQAWIKLKESQCGLVNYYYRDARFSEKWKTRCEAIMTIRRVEELKQLSTGIDW